MAGERSPQQRVPQQSEPRENSIPISYPTPLATTTPSQHPSGFIGDLSVLSCPSDPEPAVTSRVESLPGDVIRGILQLTDATSGPPKSMSHALIDIYFQELYWIAPILSRSEINKVDSPVLLLQSVYFAGGLMRRSKSWPPSSSPEACYRKIKTLLLLDYERDKLVVLQALCLLSLWSPNIPQMITLDCPWHWTGMAIRLALQFGMHREITYSSRAFDPVYRRRLWWFLFVSFLETKLSESHRPATVQRNAASNLLWPSGHDKAARLRCGAPDIE